MFKSYEIDYKQIDRPTFFRSLGKYFHEATTLYSGGDKIAEDVMLCYASHEKTEGFDLADTQIWTYCGLFSQELMEQLAVLSENHDFVEIFERLSLYKENELLLRWYNVLLDTKIWVSDVIPEETTSPFAQELDLKYAGLTAEDLCTCILLPDSATVLMGCYRLWDEASKTLEEVKQRGKPYYWLSANKCRQCGQWWLVAQEEHNDVWCLRRLNQETTDHLLKDDIWPSDFDKYATLLALAKEAGRRVLWIEGMDPVVFFIPIAELARETPGIHISKIAELLNLDTSTAMMLAEKVVKEKGVHITFDTSLRRDG
jgi:hypothetical protein